MKTDNSEKIEAETGYIIGGLFEETNGGLIEKIDCYKGNYDEDKKEEGSIYDDLTGNFHLVPDNPDKMKEVEKAIKEKRDELEKYLSNNKIEGYTFEKGKGSRGNNKGLKKTSNGKFDSDGCLFRYLRVANKNRCYDINFMRFYTNEGVGELSEKTVNCVLKCLQFSSEIKVRKVCYPKSSKNGAIETNVDKVYFNPEAKFYDSPENIKEAFFCFIDRVEKENSKNTEKIEN